MIRYKKLLTCAALSASLFVAGCSYIPSLDRFTGNLPETYPVEDGYDPDLSNQNGTTLSDLSWQEFFQDATLKQLIQTGLENNRELESAALRIDEARTLYGIERAGLFPRIDAEGQYLRQKTNRSGSGAAGNQSVIFDRYAVNLGLSSYELDFFGRIRSLEGAALNDYLAQEAVQRNVKITLIAEIASTYAQLKANQALYKLAQETLQAREDSYDLIKLRAEKGVATDLELAQAETLFLSAKVDLYRFQNEVAQNRNALRLLLGTPKDLPPLGMNADMEGISGFVANVPAGLPSEILISRPDIMAAEYRLYSANADIGAARAAFFPRIALTANAGYSASELDNLFESGSQVWQFSPVITIPIFTAGALRRSLDLSEIRKEIAVVDYEVAIEQAFREVSDSLSAVSTYDDRVRAQRDLVNAAKKRLDLSEKRYDVGVENYLAVLDAKREFYAARQNLMSLQAEELIAKVTLYRAVGGGAFLGRRSIHR